MGRREVVIAVEGHRAAAVGELLGRAALSGTGEGLRRGADEYLVVVVFESWEGVRVGGKVVPQAEPQG